jgi:Fe-S oxidoreductase
MTRFVLYSGCAAEHDRRPVRWAALDVAKMLGLDLVESGVLACCGARAYHDDVAPSASHLLQPLVEPAKSGQPIVCLSPVCRQALACHLRVQLEAAGDGSQLGETVIDYVKFMSRAGDFSPKLARSLARLNIALHSVCHAGHNQQLSPSAPLSQAAQVWRSSGATALAVAPLPAAAAIAPDVAASAPGEELGRIVAYTGAVVLRDVSAISDQNGNALTPEQPGVALRHSIALAAEAGADLVVTPCHLCFSDLNRLQRTLQTHDPARSVPVFHLAQLLGLALDGNPVRLGLGDTAVSARKVLLPYRV